MSDQDYSFVHTSLGFIPDLLCKIERERELVPAIIQLRPEDSPEARRARAAFFAAGSCPHKAIPCSGGLCRCASEKVRVI